ncbi:MAG: DUF2510 domain-containing protein [Actinomycetota bacterium]|nr:MAG: DUF2510 domain-containing protein [Actinomycetota bacterium]
MATLGVAGTKIPGEPIPSEVKVAINDIATVDYRDANIVRNGRLDIRTKGGRRHQLHFLKKHTAGFAALYEELTRALAERSQVDPVAHEGSWPATVKLRIVPDLPPPPPPDVPAGWYPNPHGPGQKYWDGSGWTEHTAPQAAPPPHW